MLAAARIYKLGRFRVFKTRLSYRSREADGLPAPAIATKPERTVARICRVPSLWPVAVAGRGTGR